VLNIKVPHVLIALITAVDPALGKERERGNRQMLELEKEGRERGGGTRK
jgi:hypothetical protein